MQCKNANRILISGLVVLKPYSCFFSGLSLFLIVFFVFVTEREYLHNSDCPFCFLFEDFRIYLRYNIVNYTGWHVYKPLFGSSDATCRLVYTEISLSKNRKS